MAVDFRGHPLFPPGFNNPTRFDADVYDCEVWGQIPTDIRGTFYPTNQQTLAQLAIAIVVLAVGPHERGRALGLQSAAQAIGLGAGPAAGGLILDTLGWHWAFWINVPFGIAGALLGWFVLPQTPHLQSGARFEESLTLAEQIARTTGNLSSFIDKLYV